MSDWRSIDDDPADWSDVGRTVELRASDGTSSSGELEAEAWFNGEDEIPILSVCGRSFYDFDEWRIVE